MPDKMLSPFLPEKGVQVKRHIAAYDLVRVVAMLMVVAVHSFPGNCGEFSAWYKPVMQALLFPCNVIFFMMSGRLNIREVPDDGLARYYYRKATRVLLPALIYMLLVTLYFSRGETPFHVFRTYAINVLSSYSGTAYWFIYSLFGYLMVAPVVAPAILHITPGRRNYFIALYLLFMTPIVLLCRTSHGFSWGFPMGAFFGSFLIGAMIDLEELAHRPLWKIASLTFGCVAMSACLLRLGFPHHPVNDNTPMYYIAGAGMFVLLYALGERMPESRVLAFVAKYSFGVYLIHNWLIPTISKYAAFGPAPLAHMSITLATTACSIVIAVAVDSVLVRPLQGLCDRAWAIVTHEA